MINIDKLSSRIIEEKEDEVLMLEKIKDPELKNHYTGYLESMNVRYALGAMHLDNDFTKARHHFYLAARVAEYELKRHSYIDGCIQCMGFALLSDDINTIRRYGQMKTVMGNKWIGAIYINSIQCVINGQIGQLDDWMKRYEELFAKKKQTTYLGCLDVLQGIKGNDLTLAQQGIDNLLKTHKRRPGLEYIDPYFSNTAATMAKLAWMSGLEVTVQNELLPMEILPLKPLPFYDDVYDFLKEEN